MIKIIGILVLISAGLVALTYNGIFKDKNKNGVPDKVEDKLKQVKKKSFRNKK